MKTLRTAGIMMAVALSAAALALLPSIEETPVEPPGISVGESSAASDGESGASSDGGGETSALPGDVPEQAASAGESVALPRSTASDQKADSSAGDLEYEPSKAPEPTSAARSGGSSGSSGSGGSEGSTGSSSSGDSSAAREPAAPKKSAAPKQPAPPPAPSSSCEWDDGEWDCDDDGDDDDGGDDGDDDDD
ncbi:hypothetical protein [Brachybacterium fresconis]|uniref:Membrane protein YgcG n=1 Tax=Brachybacterium fresconis TaxID=173363 RepID=A0ABS4YPR4_9MICO|nr:hypothetical protein [Brachybacterium fresconis]MBP2409933.1 putative membrane protein YgcG [Brachybacterium fresconis]